MNSPQPTDESFLKRLAGGASENKWTLARIATVVSIFAALFGAYISLSENLTTAKAARDEQMKGYAVQVGVLHAEVNGLKEDVERLTKWNKSLTERVNAQEQASLRRESDSLQDRINRLEDAAMGLKGKRK